VSPARFNRFTEQVAPSSAVRSSIQDMARYSGTMVARSASRRVDAVAAYIVAEFTLTSGGATQLRFTYRNGLDEYVVGRLGADCILR
jgi:hypothetical protein